MAKPNQYAGKMAKNGEIVVTWSILSFMFRINAVLNLYNERE